MKYTQLGESGLVVSRLTFGTMTFGEGHFIGEWNTDLGQKAANKMIGRCIDAGINFFDTADMYTSGQSEQILGKAVKSIRDDVIISTKCYWRSGTAITSQGSSSRYIHQAIENSLRRLGTDYIDLYIVHSPDPITPLEETCRALDEIVTQGKARYVGFSNYPAWRAQKAVGIQQMNGYSPFINAQMYYSLLGREIENEVIPFCIDNGVGITAWSPLAGGFLTGKYTRSKKKSKSNRRDIFDFPPIDEDIGYDVVDHLKKLAKKYKASVAQIALAWVLAKPYIDSVIIGATKMSQLDDNIGAMEIELDYDDVAELDSMTEPDQQYPVWFARMGYDEMLVNGLGERFVPSY